VGTGERMTKHAEIPIDCWPAVLRDEHAAAYAGETTIDAFLSRMWVRYGRSRSRHRYRQRQVQSVGEDRSGQGDRPGSV